MRSRWLPVPTGRLALAAALLSIAVATFPGDSTTGLLVVNGLLVTAALADWALATDPRALTIERTLRAML